MSRADIETAIGAAVDEQKLRNEALKLAIQAIRKMPYGNPGIKATLDLANAFYSFLRGAEQ